MGGGKGHGSFKNPKSKKPSVGGGGGLFLCVASTLGSVSVGRSISRRLRYGLLSQNHDFRSFF